MIDLLITCHSVIFKFYIFRSIGITCYKNIHFLNLFSELNLPLYIILSSLEMFLPKNQYSCQNKYTNFIFINILYYFLFSFIFYSLVRVKLSPIFKMHCLVQEFTATKM